MTAASGVLVIDKPAGLTSQQVVGRCRRLLQTRKVGHAGTLDPMATGVLIVGVNRATRMLGHLALHDKRYLATIRLGQATSTDDAEGQVLASVDACGVSGADVAKALPALRGDIAQVPSTVSAIKVNGKRAYALARSGQSVELKARQVTVSRFDVLAERRDGPFLDLDVDEPRGADDAGTDGTRPLALRRPGRRQAIAGNPRGNESGGNGTEDDRGHPRAF